MRVSGYKNAFLSLLSGFALSSALSACQTTSADHQGAQRPERLLPVYAVTTRALGHSASDIFTGERDIQAHMVRHEVHLPAGRIEGEVNLADEEAHSKPHQHFMLMKTDNFFTRATFASRLQKERGHRRVVLFVHGYNNTYRDALYRVSQVYDDAGLSGMPVLFSFASRGKLLDYGYDKDSATIARSHLAHIIEHLLKTTNGELDIIAHSMGNWVTVEALRELRLRHGENGLPRLGEVMLVSPDIDADVFATQWPLIKPLAKEVVLVCNPNDIALRASSVLRGEQERLGNLTSCIDTAKKRYIGLKTVDISPYDDSSGDPLRHNPGTNSVLIERFAAHIKRGNQLAKPNAGNTAENIAAATAGLVDGVVGIIPRAVGQGTARP
jgi:esterase/lipase superfamily enzyme